MGLVFHEPSKPVPMPKQKRNRIIFIFVACIILVVAIIIFAWYISPRQQMIRAIKRSDYNEVISIKSKNSDVLDEKTIHLLSDRLTMIELDYQEGKIDYDTAISQIGLIKSLEDSSLSEVADQMQNKILSIDYSKNVYKQGVTALEAGEYGKAVILFEEVIDSDIDNYSSAQQKKNEAVEKYRNEVIAKANDEAEANDYVGAISILQASFDIIPDDKIINAKISEYRQMDKNHNIDAILSSASDVAVKGDFVGAINLIEPNVIKYDNDERLTDKMNEYTSSFVSKVMVQVEEKENEQNYTEAIQLLTEAMDKLPNNAELSDKLSQVQNIKKVAELAERKEQILQEAEEALNNDGYANAIQILQSVPELKDDQDITNKIMAYKEYEPVSVYDLLELNRIELSNDADSLVDTFNNDYVGTGEIFTMYTKAGMDSYCSQYTFYTDWKYSKIKGKCAVQEDFKGEAELIVYGGKGGYYGNASTPLYKINVDRSTKPFEINVDISGYEWITINFHYIKNTGCKGDLICIDWAVNK